MEKAKAQKEREEYEKRREEQVLSEKMDMLSNVANEIKTPLTIIKTPLNTLSELEILKGDENFESVISSIDMLDRMTGDILDYIRAEENGYILNKRNIDIVEKLSFICMNFKEVFSDRSIAIRFTPKEKKLTVFADSKVIDRILTAVMNYISGYAMNSVDVNLFKDGQNLKMEVTYDTSPVSDRHEEYVFKPLSQYASTRSTGIGLSYARTLANIHGGTLGFMLDESRTKATFTLELPLEPLGKSEETVNKEDFANTSLPLILLVDGCYILYAGQHPQGECQAPFIYEETSEVILQCHRGFISRRGDESSHHMECGSYPVGSGTFRCQRHGILFEDKVRQVQVTYPFCPHIFFHESGDQADLHEERGKSVC